MQGRFELFEDGLLPAAELRECTVELGQQPIQFFPAAFFPREPANRSLALPFQALKGRAQRGRSAVEGSDNFLERAADLPRRVARAALEQSGEESADCGKNAAHPAQDGSERAGNRSPGGACRCADDFDRTPAERGRKQAGQIRREARRLVACVAESFAQTAGIDAEPHQHVSNRIGHEKAPCLKLSPGANPAQVQR